MIEWLHKIFDLIYSVKINLWLAIGLYYVPAAICLWKGTADVVRRYRNDKMDRKLFRNSESHAHYYYPTVTVGSIVMVVFVTITPALNLLYALFNHIGEIFMDTCEFIHKVFTHPLVPKDK